MGLIKRSFDKENNSWIPAQIGTVVASMSKRQYGLQHFVMNPVDYVAALVYACMICGVWLLMKANAPEINAQFCFA